jgi:hypothetical protein
MHLPWKHLQPYGQIVTMCSTRAEAQRITTAAQAPTVSTVSAAQTFGNATVTGGGHVLQGIINFSGGSILNRLPNC